MRKTILVVDDDHDIVRLIEDSLTYENYCVLKAYTGNECMEILKSYHVDYIILDIMLPGEDGLEICKKIRQLYVTPIMFLSAKNREFDKVIGLEMGGDDYMTKPFSVQELISRLKAYFRIIERVKESWLKEGKVENRGCLRLSENTYEVWLNDKKLDFSTKEFQILYYLSQHPKQVFSREQIYERVWEDEYGDMNTVTVHIKNIRKKLGKEYDVIKTVWGVGYRFVEEV